MKKIIAKFHPQMWADDRAIDVDPLGETEFDVTEYVLKQPLNRILKLSDNDTTTDHMAWVDTAPNWVQEWPGPFYITVEESIREFLREASNNE